MDWNFKTMWDLLKSTALAWITHGAPRLGAALAFYTIFAVAPLFLIVLSIAGMWFGEETAQQELFGQLQNLLGEEGSEAVQSVIAAANQPESGLGATTFGVIALLIGATGVFVQLQGAMNIIWNVRREPGRSWYHFLIDRLLSFAMIVSIGFLLLVSLIINAGLSVLSNYVQDFLPEQEFVWGLINFAVSLGVITILFALIFKVLPDVEIGWREVWIGAFLTSLLFNVGKHLLGLYLGRSTLASAYGAAGSLVIVLLWVYYSSQILFFGAEFTRLITKRNGRKLKPSPGAYFVVLKETKQVPEPSKK